MKEMIMALALMSILLVPAVAAQSFNFGNMFDPITNFINNIISGIQEIPNMINGWVGAIQGINNYCEDDPYNSICICNADENKRTYNNKRYCESNTLMFNPASATFDADVLAYAKQQLIAIEPNCDTSCNGGQVVKGNVGETTLGTQIIGRSVVYECDMFWTRPWTINIGIETGQVITGRCNPNTTPPAPGTAAATITSGTSNSYNAVGIFRQGITFQADCIGDNGKATTTVSLPSGFSATSWAMGGSQSGIAWSGSRWIGYADYNTPAAAASYQECSIKSSSASSATIECDLGCPAIGIGGSGKAFSVWAYDDSNPGMFKRCTIDYIYASYVIPVGGQPGIEYIQPGKSMCCNSLRRSLTCQSDGTWSAPGTTYCNGGTSSSWASYSIATPSATYNC